MSTTESRTSRARWSSERTFVLSMAAAAVGLGNIWRFPYVAGENGGATFIIAYLIAILALGLPLMFMELSAGSIQEGGVVRSFRGVNDRAAPFGWLVVGLTLIILSYYLVITGWTLGYAIDSVTGSLQTFDSFTDGSAPVVFFGIVTVASAWVAYRGVDLIERYSVLLMPVLLVVILVLSGYGLTLSGRADALEFLFSPDFSDFASPEVWALAFGQAFYSLAIGQGYLMTYGSYLPDRVNLPRGTATVAGVETTVALIAGLMIFPIVFTFGLDPAEGTDLAFTSLPLAFDDMAIGWLLAIVFFWLFFLAAFSSCIASMKVIKTALVEELRTTNGKAILLAVVGLLPLGILSAFSFTPLEVELLGRPFLEFMDLVTANQVVILSGLIGGAILGWSTPRQVVVDLFPDRHRPLALHTIRAVRYMWVIVLLVLTASLLA